MSTHSTNTVMSGIVTVSAVIETIIKWIESHEVSESAIHGAVTAVSGYIVVELIKYVRTKINKKKNG